jgi:hypothetical protein
LALGPWPVPAAGPGAPAPGGAAPAPAGAWADPSLTCCDRFEFIDSKLLNSEEMLWNESMHDCHELNSRSQLSSFEHCDIANALTLPNCDAKICPELSTSEQSQNSSIQKIDN